MDTPAQPAKSVCGRLVEDVAVLVEVDFAAPQPLRI
jgi:hypothetical protein